MAKARGFTGLCDKFRHDGFSFSEKKTGSPNGEGRLEAAHCQMAEILDVLLFRTKPEDPADPVIVIS